MAAKLLAVITVLTRLGLSVVGYFVYQALNGTGELYQNISQHVVQRNISNSLKWFEQFLCIYQFEIFFECYKITEEINSLTDTKTRKLEKRVETYM